MLYDADCILDMGFLRDLYKNFAVITLAVSVSLWPFSALRFLNIRVIRVAASSVSRQSESRYRELSIERPLCSIATVRLIG